MLCGGRAGRLGQAPAFPAPAYQVFGSLWVGQPG
jgi:hypothetical protein